MNLTIVHFSFIHTNCLQYNYSITSLDNLRNHHNKTEKCRRAYLSTCFKNLRTLMVSNSDGESSYEVKSNLGILRNAHKTIKVHILEFVF